MGPAPRNPGIDLLRGVSIVLVVLHHLALRLPLTRTSLAAFVPVRVLKALSYNGYEAVFVFFVISGFLIGSHAIARWGALDSIDLRAFYVRRASRILPCLLALLVVLGALHLASATDYVITRPGQSLPRATLAALGLHLNWYEGRTGYLPGAWDVLWSLSIEEAFYLGFPIVSRVRLRFLVPCLVVLALSLPFTRAALASNEIWQEKAYLPGMAAIAAGVLGALATARFPNPRRATSIALGVVGTLGLVAILFYENVLWPILGDGCVLVLTIAATCLVLCAHALARNRKARWLGTGWLRSFGRLSYEVYLTHMFVVFALVRAHRALGVSEWRAILWYAPLLALSWALGWLVARVFSVPCERAIRSFGARERTSTAAKRDGLTDRSPPEPLRTDRSAP